MGRMRVKSHTRRRSTKEGGKQVPKKGLLGRLLR